MCIICICFSVYVCVYVCVSIYINMCACIVCMYLWVYIFVYICAYVYMCMHFYVCACWALNVYVCLCHIYLCICMHVYVWVDVTIQPQELCIFVSRLSLKQACGLSSRLDWSTRLPTMSVMGLQAHPKHLIFGFKHKSGIKLKCSCLQLCHLPGVLCSFSAVTNTVP